MRWGYIIPRATILLVMWAFFTFALDPLLHRGVVETGQAAVGAKVDVENVRTRLFPPAVVVDDVAVANRKKPGTNLVEFQSARMRLDGGQLLKKRFVVNEAEITGLRWGTPRSDSGLLEEKNAENELKLKFNWSERAEEFGKQWLDYLIAKAKLQLDPNLLETVRISQVVHEEWKARFEFYETRVKTFDRRIEQLEDLVKSADGDPLERFTVYQQAAAEVQRLLADAEATRKELAQLGGQAETDFDRIEQARQRDLVNLKTKLELFTSLDPQQLSEAFLGPQLAKQLEQIVYWTQWAKSQYRSVSMPEEPTRSRGQEIAFESFDEMPVFVMRKLAISGEAKIGDDAVPFAGTVSGVTNDPAMLKEPVIVNVNAQGKGRLNLIAELDYRVDEPVHDLVLSYSVDEPDSLRIGDEEHVAIDVAADQSAWQAKVRQVGEEFSARLQFQQRGVSLNADLGDHEDENVRRLLQTALSRVRDVEAVVEIEGPLEEPVWTLRSNLGEQLAGGLTEALTAEFALHQNQLAARIDEAARAQMVRLDEMLAKNFQELAGKLNLNDAAARELIQKVAGRDLNLPGGDLNRMLGPNGLPQIPDLQNAIDLQRRADELQNKFDLPAQIPGGNLPDIVPNVIPPNLAQPLEDGSQPPPPTEAIPSAIDQELQRRIEEQRRQQEEAARRKQQDLENKIKDQFDFNRLFPR